MANISLQVLQGADRGKVFRKLATPITVGREEGNSVQLNDERISRYHIKIQEDNDQLVLTDLDSTNGTQVNGQDCQLRVLRFGDLIAVGRSVLLVGSPEEIAQHMESLTSTGEARGRGSGAGVADFDLSTGINHAVRQLRATREGFFLPERLSPAQAAQLAELLENITNRLGDVVRGARPPDSEGQPIGIPLAEWQILLDLGGKLGALIRRIGEPESTEGPV